jgi:ABC-type nickel/cobalt efflux system permease component RcnA
MRRVRFLLAAVAIAVAALAAPALASAHPLGNFTTNRYDEVVASGDRLYVLSVLDLAEIPTFQAKPDVARLGHEGYASSVSRQIEDALAVSVDGAPRSLRALRHTLVFPQGVGGLHTTRLEVVYDAGSAPASGTVSIRDGSYPDRIGWREIVVSASRGAALDASDAPTRSISDRLLVYPKNLLTSPLHVRTAAATVRAGTADGEPPALGHATTAPVRASSGTGSFASLVARDHLSVGFVLVALLLALFWGSAHALTPGHGKSIVAAYLVGSRGRARDALALGGIVTLTHTIGVFALGLVTLALSEFIVPEDLYPWLNLVSAVLVVCVGVVVLRERIRAALGSPSRLHSHGHGHSHAHEQSHGHHHHEGMTDEEHAQAHLPAAGTGWRGLLAVGISGGIIPCPTALVVLLAAISLHRVAFGMLLIVAFSAGLALSITGVGLVAVLAKRAFGRLSADNRVFTLLPALSALVILVAGVAMTVHALPKVS